MRSNDILVLPTSLARHQFRPVPGFLQHRREHGGEGPGRGEVVSGQQRAQRLGRGGMGRREVGEDSEPAPGGQRGEFGRRVAPIAVDAHMAARGGFANHKDAQWPPPHAIGDGKPKLRFRSAGGRKGAIRFPVGDRVGRQIQCKEVSAYLCPRNGSAERRRRHRPRQGETQKREAN